MPYLSKIATALPHSRYSQNELRNFMQDSYGQNNEWNRKLSLIYRKSGIDNRYSCLTDFGKENHGFSSLKIQDRMHIYQKEALKLSLAAVSELELNDVQEITHIITVSCTGMYAPGLDIDLVRELNLPKNIVRSSVNFMGCYAAIHGLKWANDIALANTDANVLMVCVELCTLHFRNDPAWEQVAACSLFSDGATACIVSSKKHENSKLRIEGFYSELVLEGHSDMAWHIAEDGFLMQLSSYIPSLLAKPINGFLQAAKQKIGINTIDKYGFHPGGRKILDYIKDELKVTHGDVAVSYEVLRKYGNMSSPTVLFVLKEIIESLKNDETVFSAAFGPGLSMESMITRGV